MNRLTRILSVTAFLILSLHFQGMAQGLVTPPKGLPQERWELTYDDYRARAYDIFDVSEYNRDPDNIPIPSNDILVGLRREVTWVRYGADVYIKGIFREYPEAWVKGTVNDDKVYFESTQLLEGTVGERIYLHSGSVYYDAKNSNRSISLGMSFEPLEYPGGDYIGYYYEIFINEDRSAITPANIDNAMSGNAFWLSKDKEPKSEFHTTWHDGKVEGTPFPDPSTCMMNMVFRKVTSSGVDVVRPDPK